MTFEAFITVLVSLVTLVAGGVGGYFVSRIGLMREIHRLELQIQELRGKLDFHERTVNQVSTQLFSKLQELYSLEGKKDGNR